MTKATDHIGIPLLITSAINVSAEQTKLLSVDARLKYTLQSIERWRSTPMVSDIVICDGSGFDLQPYIKKLVKNQAGVKCEFMSFINDVTTVQAKGKGYGEGEIVNYALQNSRVLKSSKVFAKCTGKLWVKNFSKCLKGFNGIAAFDFRGKLKPVQIDTRFYVVNKDFFNEHLAQLYKFVNDSKDYYLEHAFCEVLKSFKMSNYLMCPTPRIIGVSGSMGFEFQQTSIKSYVRDLRAFLIKKSRML